MVYARCAGGGKSRKWAQVACSFSLFVLNIACLWCVRVALFTIAARVGVRGN